MHSTTQPITYLHVTVNSSVFCSDVRLLPELQLIEEQIWIVFSLSSLRIPPKHCTVSTSNVMHK